MSEPDPGPHFDLAAAGLRADGTDLEHGIEVLARKLEISLPRACRIKRRRRSLLSSEQRVVAIDIDLGASHYSLRWEGGALVPVRVARVHDMRRTREILPLAGWLRAVEDELRAAATDSQEARDALDRLLGS